MRRSTPRGRVSEANHQRLLLLNETASYRVEELLSQLGVGFRRQGKMLVGPCPVHGGAKQDKWQMYPDGHSARGLWYCRSRGCEKVFQRTIAGLVRGVLSRERLGWEPGCKGRLVSMKTAIDYVCRFLGQKWQDLRPDWVSAEKHKFVAEQALFGRTPEVRGDGTSPEQVRARLEIPSKYFLSRGYPADVLTRYLVGEPKSAKPDSPMYRRAVVPVFDNDGRLVVGYTGRSLVERCATCGRWHEGDCPPERDAAQPRYAKWRNHGFHKEHHLYNFWAAKAAIRETGTVILVEGPGDVWALEAGGVKNAVGLFGVTLNDPQQVLLERSGAMNVILLLDSDWAGAAGLEEIRRALCRGFNVTAPKLTKKDVGAYAPTEVREYLLPLLEMTKR